MANKEWRSDDEFAPWGNCPEEECEDIGVALEEVDGYSDHVYCPECTRQWPKPGPNAPRRES